MGLDPLKLTFVFAFGAFCPIFPVYGEESAAIRAGLGEGLKISDKSAIRVVTAAIKDALFFI